MPLPIKVKKTVEELGLDPKYYGWRTSTGWYWRKTKEKDRCYYITDELEFYPSDIEFDPAKDQERKVIMNETITNVATEATELKSRQLDANVEAGLIAGDIVTQTPADQGDETRPID